VSQVESRDRRVRASALFDVCRSSANTEPQRARERAKPHWKKGWHTSSFFFHVSVGSMSDEDRHTGGMEGVGQVPHPGGAPGRHPPSTGGGGTGDNGRRTRQCRAPSARSTWRPRAQSRTAAERSSCVQRSYHCAVYASCHSSCGFRRGRGALRAPPRAATVAQLRVGTWRQCELVDQASLRHFRKRPTNSPCGCALTLALALALG
jgi:hypothetical protein